MPIICKIKSKLFFHKYNLRQPKGVTVALVVVSVFPETVNLELVNRVEEKSLELQHIPAPLEYGKSELATKNSYVHCRSLSLLEMY